MAAPASSRTNDASFIGSSFALKSSTVNQDLEILNLVSEREHGNSITGARRASLKEVSEKFQGNFSAAMVPNPSRGLAVIPGGASRASEAQA